MTIAYGTLWRWAFLVCIGCLPAHAQNTQFLPEIDAHLTINSTFRAYLQAQDNREGGDPLQFTFGPSLQIYLKPLISLKKVTEFDLDASKSRFLVLETGYRYITAPDTPPETRLIEAAISNFPLRAGVFSLRPEPVRSGLEKRRILLAVSEQIDAAPYFCDPFLSLHSVCRRRAFLRESVQQGSTTSLYAGSLFPVGKHVQFNTYFEHDNNTGKHPNRQVNSVGLVLNLYFSLEK